MNVNRESEGGRTSAEWRVEELAGFPLIPTVLYTAGGFKHGHSHPGHSFHPGPLGGSTVPSPTDATGLALRAAHEVRTSSLCLSTRSQGGPWSLLHPDPKARWQDSFPLSVCPTSPCGSRADRSGTEISRAPGRLLGGLRAMGG